MRGLLSYAVLDGVARRLEDVARLVCALLEQAEPGCQGLVDAVALRRDRRHRFAGGRRDPIVDPSRLETEAPLTGGGRRFEQSPPFPGCVAQFGHEATV